MDPFFTGLGLVAVMAVVIPLGLLVLALAVVFNGRRDPDPTGRRTTAVYLGVVCFVALFTLVTAGTVTIDRLASLLVDDEHRAESADDGGEFFSVGGPVPIDDFDRFDDDFDRFDDDFDRFDDEVDDQREQERRAFDEQVDRVDDQSIRDSVRAGLVALPALVVFAFHWRRRQVLVSDPSFADSPAGRADRVYLYVTCLVAAVVGLFAAGNAVYDVFRLIAPGVSSDLGDSRLVRQLAVADLITMAVLTIATVVVFFEHWARVSGERTPWGRVRDRRRSGRAPAETDTGVGD